jgi:hypothetical protein
VVFESTLVRLDGGKKGSNGGKIDVEFIGKHKTVLKTESPNLKWADFEPQVLNPNGVYVYDPTHFMFSDVGRTGGRGRVRPLCGICDFPVDRSSELIKCDYCNLRGAHKSCYAGLDPEG